MIKVVITGIPGQDAFVFEGLDSVVLGGGNGLDEEGSILCVLGSRLSVARALVPLLAELRSENRFGAEDFDMLLAASKTHSTEILDSTERLRDETYTHNPFKRQAGE